MSTRFWLCSLGLMLYTLYFFYQLNMNNFFLCYWHFLTTSIFNYFISKMFDNFYSTYRKTSNLFNMLVVGFGHGLRTPRQSFFSKIRNFWAWADKPWFLGLKHITPKCSQNKKWAVKNLWNSVHTSVFCGFGPKGMPCKMCEWFFTSQIF